MFSKTSTGDMMDLPAWMQECATKVTSEHYKLIIIQKFVMSNTNYYDTDVPMTAPLLKIMIKRDWTEKYENINRRYLLYAMEGLSPFTMLDIRKYEVSLLNN